MSHSLTNTFPPTPNLSSHTSTMKTNPHSTPTRPAVRRAVHLLLLALALVAGLAGAHAATGTPPDKMTYQGFLADASGVPLGNASPVNYVTVFRIWPADTGGAPGTALWSEVQNVTVDKGNFSVILGDGLRFGTEANGSLSAVFSSPTASDRYLEITVTIAGNPVTIAPRLRLVAAPYALLATTATRLVNPDGSTLLNSPSTGAVNINGAVTATSFTGDGTGLTGVLKVGGSADFGTVNAANIVAGDFSVTNKFTAAKIYSDGAMGVGITNVTRGILEVGGIGMLPYNKPLTPPVTAFSSAYGRSVTVPATNVAPRFVQFNNARGYPTNSFWSNNISGNRFVFTQSLNTNSPYTELNPQVVRDYTAFAVNGIVAMDLNFMLANINSAATSLGGSPVLTGVAILGHGVNSPTVAIQNPNYVNNQFNNNETLPQVLRIGATNYYSDDSSGSGSFGGGQSFWERYMTGVVGPVIPNTVYNNTLAGQFSTTTTAPHLFSIFADGPVAATTFFALSDARIKKVGGRSDGVADLTTLLDIEVTDYTYKDELQKGAGKHKKVIAQQVEKIYPQAVSQSTGPVPDIYERANVINGRVFLNTDLKVGEKVRLTSERGDTIHEVLDVRASSFRVDLPESITSVFVYGREVNDFRSVDYEALAMLNVSATQELARQVEALRKSEARIAELEQKNSQLSALERKVADLEKLLSQVVAGRTATPAAEAPAPSAKTGNNQ
jgi:hypothetical protein